jgi:hypothetical protein
VHPRVLADWMASGAPRHFNAAAVGEVPAIFFRGTSEALMKLYVGGGKETDSMMLDRVICSRIVPRGTGYSPWESQPVNVDV